MKNLGRVSAWMIFSSSWQAWPDTCSISALSYTTSAPLRNSSLITRPTVTSLPGMALAEMMTLSPGPMSTCLWVENAMRYRALISSPCEPVVTMTCWFRGSPFSRLMSTSVFFGTFMYPSSVDTFIMFSMLRPVTATFRPQAAAASSTC